MRGEEEERKEIERGERYREEKEGKIGETDRKGKGQGERGR